MSKTYLFASCFPLRWSCRTVRLPAPDECDLRRWSATRYPAGGSATRGSETRGNSDKPLSQQELWQTGIFGRWRRAHRTTQRTEAVGDSAIPDQTRRNIYQGWFSPDAEPTVKWRTSTLGGRQFLSLAGRAIRSTQGRNVRSRTPRHRCFSRSAIRERCLDHYHVGCPDVRRIYREGESKHWPVP